MQVASVPGPASLSGELPLWPPVLAARGPGGRTSSHAHHALHLLLAVHGSVRISVGGRMRRTAGVVTPPDSAHAIDASGREVLVVFIEPESEAGARLTTRMAGAPLFLGDAVRRSLLESADPLWIMREGQSQWLTTLLQAVGAGALPPRTIHPRVRKLLRLLRALPAHADHSLESLAAQVRLSPGRLMHVFTQSLGVPLRPYLLWVRVQRAAAAIASGSPLTRAAAAAGFVDSAHMSRTFRAMFGATPSMMRPPGTQRPRTAAS